MGNTGDVPLDLTFDTDDDDGDDGEEIACAIVPVWLILSRVSNPALRLYVLLAARADETRGRVVEIRASRVAAVLDKEEDSVQRYFDELVAGGALKMRDGGYKLVLKVPTRHRGPVTILG